MPNNTKNKAQAILKLLDEIDHEADRARTANWPNLRWELANRLHQRVTKIRKLLEEE